MMFNLRRNNGFTFIELVVVISLISLMLFFAIPRFQGSVFQDNSKKVSRWIRLKIQSLKEKAIRDQKLYVLHIDIDSNTLWATHSSMSQEEIQTAENNGYNLPNGIKVLDVEYPDNKIASIGQTDIHFYKKGYSDKAMIHIENNDNEQLSFLIEPFLTSVRMYQEYVELND